MRYILFLWWINSHHYMDHYKVVRGFQSESECIRYAEKQDPNGEEISYVCQHDARDIQP